MTAKTLEVGVLLTGEAVQFTDIAPVDTLTMITPEYLDVLGPAIEPLRSQAVAMKVSYIHEGGEGLFPLTGQVKIAVTHSLTTAPPLDILVIPGPPPKDVANPAVDEFIQSTVAHGTTILSICTGVFPLAAAGVLEGRTATAPVGLLPMLRAAHPNVKWESARRFEKSAGGDGKSEIWTSGSVANGVDLAIAFMRERFPESRTLTDLTIGIASIAEREVEYEEKEKAWEKAFEGASLPV
ncbi:ThiJ/PfpI [Botryosphaeria dothidea]|uniref:ThiJ/PfpI n=1 Tax=Botryosphaeria dothidea TaxID=55169 RepID=A0A8H4J9R5_9PEZI|nr:ThiJ/PfpI [Botryosphaeria dothidea]